MNDKEQTDLCNKLRDRLQSIAIQAVQAQDVIGSDKCSDLLDDIESDLKAAIDMSVRLTSEQWEN